MATPLLKPPRRQSSLSRNERIWGLIFLAPWIAGFIIFFAGPMLASLAFSFTDFYLPEPDKIRFVGLENWARMFSDPNVAQAVMATLRFLAISLPISLILPILFAALLNAKSLFGKRLFRTLFYLPVMVPLVAGAMIWQGVLNSQSGWLNRGLGALSLPTPDWLNSEAMVVPSLALIGIWGVGNAMLITLAGMQGVPTDLYEAATIDGAGPIYSFFAITLPMISPVIFYNLVLAVIGGFQEFLRALVLYGPTNGAGPNNASLLYMVNLYRESFVYFQMGYASTLAWAMFLVALVVTITLFAGARRWVYYAGGER